MKMSRPIAVCAAVAFFASVAGAETAPPVLEQIPAGSLGFAVVQNIKATASRADKFIKDIGVGKFVPPGGVLAFIKGAANLGEGFNADGGLAVAVLDPQQFGLDVLALIKPGAQPPKPSDIPVVVFVPGSGVQEVFGQLAKPAGKYFHVTLPNMPLVATHHNGYVILSPSQAAVEAVLKAKRTAADEMPKEHAAVIARSDVAYYLNMKVAGPVISGLLKVLEKEFAGMPAGAMPVDPQAVLGLYRTLISQMDALTVTAKLGAEDVSVDFMLSFLPDSGLTKVAAAYPGKTTPSVARLANLPYVMAMATVVENSKEAQELSDEMLSGLFGKNMPKAMRDLMTRMQKVASSNITGFQMVAGGGPQGKGLFGAAVLIECKDPKGVKSMLADVAGLIEGAIKSMAPNDPELQQLKIAYSNNIETIGTITVDAITITHPELENMGARDREQMKKVLGEDKVLIRVATIDAKTVAVTFGGSSAFFTETVRAAKLGGRIVSRKDAKALAKRMPAKPTGFMLFSVGNLFEVINTGMQVMEPDASMPFKISTKDPIVISGGYMGTASHVIFSVPTKLIKDAVEAIGGFFGAMGGSVPLPPPNGDF